MKNKLKYILGVDIGGSHITAAVVDMENKKVLTNTYIRRHVNSRGSVSEIMALWTNAIQKSIGLSGIDVSYIGLALPGPFDYDQGICLIKNQDKYEKLYKVNVKEKLAKSLKLPIDYILLSNDAFCFLKGEVFVGKATDVANVLGLTLGTGLGSVVSIKGEVRDAELWCSAYKDGIAEDYLSTRWFITKYLNLTGKPVKNVLQLCEEAPKVLIDDIFTEFANNLKEFLQLQIAAFRVEKVIIGGNIAKASAYFMPVLQELPVSIEINVSGEGAALLGAASNFVEKYEEHTIFNS
ncbi:ROK family protein [Sphingobacterium haloxyli]|uniref:ROK family protein n=1 Tax=Sphingobacterium haloxyli TaxID=2100533 RepID=A0A2S9J804_9SPHI|nr:ROK family protein [Sphingobacterium haloxyli]PRD48877.1 ROK family protein [Sphingobacterium haloxyli]